MNETKLLQACQDLMYWYKKAHETPEMLLSSHHVKSDECAEIMRKYNECFVNIQSILDSPKDVQSLVPLDKEIAYRENWITDFRLKRLDKYIQGPDRERYRDNSHFYNEVNAKVAQEVSLFMPALEYIVEKFGKSVQSLGEVDEDKLAELIGKSHKEWKKICQEAFPTRGEYRHIARDVVKTFGTKAGKGIKFNDLFELELETKDRESFSLGFAIGKEPCQQLVDYLNEHFKALEEAAPREVPSLEEIYDAIPCEHKAEYDCEKCRDIAIAIRERLQK